MTPLSEDDEGVLLSVFKGIEENYHARFASQITAHDAKYGDRPSLRYSGAFRKGVDFTIVGILIGYGNDVFHVSSLRQSQCNDEGWSDRFLDSFRFIGQKKASE
jgi:hypothetical protein